MAKTNVRVKKGRKLVGKKPERRVHFIDTSTKAGEALLVDHTKRNPLPRRKKREIVAESWNGPIYADQLTPAEPPRVVTTFVDNGPIPEKSLIEEVAEYIKTLTFDGPPPMDIIEFTDGSHVPTVVQAREERDFWDTIEKRQKIAKILKEPEIEPPVETQTDKLRREFKEAARRLAEHIFAEAMAETFAVQG